MAEPPPNLLQQLLTTSSQEMPMVMALLGGFARVLQRPAALSVTLLLGRIIASAFAGAVVYLILHDRPEISHGLKAAIVGIAGYAGVDLLDILSARLIRFAQKRKDDETSRRNP